MGDVLLITRDDGAQIFFAVSPPDRIQARKTGLLRRESLQLDLGFKPVLSLHHHINHLEPIIMPFFDSAQVPGPPLVIDDERHNTVAQAFLEHDQSANTAIAVFKRKNLLKPLISTKMVR